MLFVCSGQHLGQQSTNFARLARSAGGRARGHNSSGRSYLDSALAHHLALSVEKGEPPPLGLLQVAETIGGADWQPALMNFSDMLAQLIAELPEAMRGGTAVETVLRKSGDLAEAVAQSWFEDGPAATDPMPFRKPPQADRGGSEA
jgi:hypothetical protein